MRGERLAPAAGLVLRLASVFAALAIAGCAGARSAARPPNVLVVFADDWGRYASAYARLEPGGLGDAVSTPAFDRVAAEGVLFTNAFVNAPSCTPSRGSLLSGQYFWRTGRSAILQGATWDPAIPSYPLMLEGRGYHIGFSGKVWSPGAPADAPYGGASRAYHRRGKSYGQFSELVSGASAPAAARARLAAEVRGNFRDFIAARPPGRPFAYWFGPTNTHRKWIRGSGKKIWGIDPDRLLGKMPADLPDVPEVREDVADYLGEAQGVDAGLAILLEELTRLGEADDTMVIVSGDHGMPGVPRGKCNLYDLGVRVALAIRWPRRVPSGRVVTDFVNLPDLTPTILEAAGGTPTAQMTGRSLLPILTSRRSGRVDPSRDFVVVGRERHVAAAREGNLPYPQRAIRTDDFLYIRNFAPDRWPMGSAPGYAAAGAMPDGQTLREDTFVAFGDMDASPTKQWLIEHRAESAVTPYFEHGFLPRPAEELYDLRKDPGQIVNVVRDPGYAKALESLAARLMRVLRDSGDPRVTDADVRFERPPFAGPLPGLPE